MLADVGMVKTYSKSAHVNDLGFVWTGPPCYYGFSARRKHFYTPIRAGLYVCSAYASWSDTGW